MTDLAAIEQARTRIADIAVRTPLIRLRLDELPAGTEVHCKLETLQPINSFKIRGAANAIRSASPEQRAGGLLTASAGNMAQGVAWVARELGLPATIAVPEHAPETKLAAIERLGGQVVKLPYDDWWQAIVTGRIEGLDGMFVHPVADERVIAGNGTIGLEILEDLPDLDTVVIPVGGGGLATGIATAIKALRPQARIVTAEPATGAALHAAMSVGEPTDVDYETSFVDGSGSRRVLDAMWPRLQPLVDEALSVPIADTAGAVRTLAERLRVIAEGAGALATAAALSGAAGGGKVVAIVSGGNINLPTLARILDGELGRLGVGRGGRESGEQPVDLLLRVVVDEADPDRVLFVAETLVQVQRVPRVVGPDSDVTARQLGRHVGGGYAVHVDQEGRHPARHRRQAVDRDGARQVCEEVLAERALVWPDRADAADRVQVVDRRVEPRQQLVRQCAGDKPAPERIDRRRPHLVRPPRLRQRRPRVRDAQMRPTELVWRAKQNVGVDLADVDRLVRRVVHGVDPRDRARLVRDLTDARGVGHGPDRIGCPRERDHPGSIAQLLAEIVEVVGRVRVQLDVLDDETAVVGELEPRRDAAVVIERGDDDLVAWAKLASGGP